MLNSRQRRVEQFNDGIAIICEAKNKAIVNAKSVILIEDEQYTVKQLQEKMDTVPPTVYITLLKAAPQYEDRRSLNESS